MAWSRAMVSPRIPATALSAPDGRSYVSLVPTQLHRMLADDAQRDLLRGYHAVLVREAGGIFGSLEKSDDLTRVTDILCGNENADRELRAALRTAA